MTVAPYTGSYLFTSLKYAREETKMLSDGCHSPYISHKRVQKVLLQCQCTAGTSMPHVLCRWVFLCSWETYKRPVPLLASRQATVTLSCTQCPWCGPRNRSPAVSGLVRQLKKFNLSSPKTDQIIPRRWRKLSKNEHTWPIWSAPCSSLYSRVLWHVRQGTHICAALFSRLLPVLHFSFFLHSIPPWFWLNCFFLIFTPWAWLNIFPKNFGA